MKRNSHNPLIALVQTLDDGIEFYRIAEAKTESPKLKTVFAKMAEAREFALAYIRPYIDQHDLDFERALTYHGTLANQYAPLLDAMLNDEQLDVVKSVELQAAGAMQKAAKETDNILVQMILKDLTPRFLQNLNAAGIAIGSKEAA